MSGRTRRNKQALRRLAERIDSEPGIYSRDLGMLTAPNFLLQFKLKELGYRTEIRNSDDDWIGRTFWWPSRARCAELARSATGERRETLLRGMLL